MNNNFYTTASRRSLEVEICEGAGTKSLQLIKSPETASQVSGQWGKMSISLEHLPSGMYQVKLTTSGGVSTKTLSVQK